MIPVIGLTTYNYENKNGFPVAALTRMYITAVAEAGGSPLLIPSGLNAEALDSLYSRLDGILLPGGVDISIERFGGEFHPRIDGADPDRDAVEIALLRSATQSGKPFLGICRGFQMVNVALGGSLYTHIQDQMPGAIKHDYDSVTERKLIAHEVKVKETTRLANVLGETKLNVKQSAPPGNKGSGSSSAPGCLCPRWAGGGSGIARTSFWDGSAMASGMVAGAACNAATISGFYRCCSEGLKS